MKKTRGWGGGEVDRLNLLDISVVALSASWRLLLLLVVDASGHIGFSCDERRAAMDFSSVRRIHHQHISNSPGPPSIYEELFWERYIREGREFFGQPPSNLPSNQTQKLFPHTHTHAARSFYIHTRRGIRSSRRSTSVCVCLSLARARGKGSWLFRTWPMTSWMLQNSQTHAAMSCWLALGPCPPTPIVVIHTYVYRWTPVGYTAGVCSSSFLYKFFSRVI